MPEGDQDASETLTLLEDRIRRVDFILHGSVAQDSGAATPIPPASAAGLRLRALERGLQALASKSAAVTDILHLQKSQPELFASSTPSEISSLPPPALISLVLAHTSLYRNTASQLSQLRETSVPDTATVTQVIDQRERIEKARARQEQQLKDFADLRGRSARLVEQWYEGGVLEMGERWASWEERLREVEILVRRREAAKRRDEGLV